MGLEFICQLDKCLEANAETETELMSYQVPLTTG